MSASFSLAATMRRVLLLGFGHMVQFLRTSSWRRKIQWSSQSKRRLDPISTAVLKVKTLTVGTLFSARVGGAEIAFFCAKEHVRLAAAPVVVLLHLGVRDQVGDFLVYVELLGRDRAVRILESRAIEGHFSAQNAIDDDQVLIEFARAVRFQTGKDGERFLQVVEPLRIARAGLVPRDDGVDLLAARRPGVS